MSEGFYLAVVNPRAQKFFGPFDTAEVALRAGDKYKLDGSSVAVLGAVNAPHIRGPHAGKVQK